MRRGFYALIGLFILASCSKEQQAKRYEGTYTIVSSSSSSTSVEDLALTPSFTITKTSSNQLNFDLLFNNYYETTITCNIESSKTASVEPIDEIGMFIQGGYELFGGSITRDGSNFLVIELDVIKYTNPDFPSTGPQFDRHTETYIYQKD